MEWRGSKMALGLATVTVMILALQVQLSVQLPLRHPLRRVVDRINQKEGPFMGLVMAFDKEELVLTKSGLFTASSYIPSIQIAGRIFNIGTVKDVPTIYVMTGEQIANAAMTMQILYDTFDVIGVVHYGIAGAVNSSLNIGDVVVPDAVAYSNSWHWTNNGTEYEGTYYMDFGKFNLPEPGKSLLGEIQYNTIELYTEQLGNGTRKNDTFWIPTDSAWLSLSLDLADVELNQCLNVSSSTEQCVAVQPQSYFGLKGSTSNVYLANVAFRDFTYRNFNFSFADEETASVVQTSVSNGKPVVVFRGISDLGGGSSNTTSTANSTTNKYIAAYNSMILAVGFIDIWGNSDGKVIRME